MNIIAFPGRRQPLRFDDLRQPDPHTVLMCERAYRRGFHQGASAAVEAIERRNALRAWLDALYAWRLRAVSATKPMAETPPAPGDSTSCTPTPPEAA